MSTAGRTRRAAMAGLRALAARALDCADLETVRARMRVGSHASGAETSFPRAQQATGCAVQDACRMTYAGLGATSCGKGIAATDLCR
jgi:hypothetical protein